MKKHILTLILVAVFGCLKAQPIIRDGSFESWNPHLSKFMPAEWWADTSEVVAGYVSRTTTSSNGTYAIRLGTDPSALPASGVYIEMYDSLTEKPGSLTFDYIVQNNNSSFVNGLVATLYFYDAAGDYLFDVDWFSPSLANNASFKSGSIQLGYKDTLVYYLLELKYLNVNGTSNEYGIFDNVKFTKYVPNPSSTGDEISDETVDVVPNPSGKLFMLATDAVPEAVTVVSMDGKSKELRSNDFGIFSVEGLDNGLYIVQWVDQSSQVLHRTRLMVAH